MVHSPMYHRLMRFVEDAKANEPCPTTTASTVQLWKPCARHKSTLSISASIRASKVKPAMPSISGLRVPSIVLSYGALVIWPRHRLRLRCAASCSTRARRRKCSLPSSLTPRLDKLRDVAEVTIPVMEQYGLVGKAFNAVASTGAAVYDAIATQANNDREAASTDILQRLNDSMQGSQTTRPASRRCRRS